MPRPRFAVLALLTAALVGVSGLPAGADPSHPTPRDLATAKALMASAQDAVAALRVRAEAAAEAYDGALSRQQRAAAARVTADRRAAAARTGAAQAEQRSATAMRAASAAGVLAGARRTAQYEAAAAEDGARQDLAQLASAAYRTGGPLAMVSSLLDARSPLELAQGDALISSVSVFQQAAITRLAAAQQVAQASSALAATAQDRAEAASESATIAVITAQRMQDAAFMSDLLAQDADRAAADAVIEADQAKLTALGLVAQAEATLGSARVRAATLVRAADQARVEADRVRSALQVPGTDRTAPLAAGDPRAAQVAISWAFAEIGIPYSWGGGDRSGPTYGFAQGAGTRGFDCSGLTLFAYGHAGIALDHYTGSQYLQGLRVSRYADLLPGDLMFFASDVHDASTIHHVGIYIGGDKIIEAPHTGDVVKVANARRSDFIGATRPWA